MRIYIKDHLAGIVHPLEVDSSDTIDALKNQIEQELGTRHDEQTLVWAGKELADGRKLLSQCNIAMESTIHMSAVFLLLAWVSTD